MIEGAIGFGVLALIGLLAAKRPQAFARYFLAEWQRQRLEGNLRGVSSVGWLIFGVCVWMAIVLLMTDLLQGS